MKREYVDEIVAMSVGGIVGIMIIILWHLANK